MKPSASLVRLTLDGVPRTVRMPGRPGRSCPPAAPGSGLELGFGIQIGVKSVPYTATSLAVT